MNKDDIKLFIVALATALHNHFVSSPPGFAGSQSRTFEHPSSRYDDLNHFLGTLERQAVQRASPRTSSRKLVTALRAELDEINGRGPAYPDG